MTEVARRKIYSSWASMKTRCDNPNSTNFERWGGRGITYPSKWKKFEGFLEDMGSSYIEGLSLDRIDNDASYSIENCRWATSREQANNRCSNRLLTFNGATKTLSEWVAETGLAHNTIIMRIDYYGWTIKKALTTKVRATC